MWPLVLLAAVAATASSVGVVDERQLTCMLVDSDGDGRADRIDLEWIGVRVQDTEFSEAVTFVTRNATLLDWPTPWRTGDVPNDAYGYVHILMDDTPAHEQAVSIAIQFPELGYWPCQPSPLAIPVHAELMTTFAGAFHSLANPQHLPDRRASHFQTADQYSGRVDVLKITFTQPLQFRPRVGAFYYIDNNGAGATSLVDVIDLVGNGTVVVVKTNYALIASDFGQFGDAIQVYQPQLIESIFNTTSVVQSRYLTDAAAFFPLDSYPVAHAQVAPQTSLLNLRVADPSLKANINLVAVKYGTLTDTDIQNMLNYLSNRT